MAKKRSKKLVEKIDGLGPDDIRKLRSAIRQVWSWSYARRLCVKRATGADGFPTCERCRKKVPKVFPDHIKKVGDLLEPGYLLRMFTPSKNLQALCKKCHDQKTRQERAQDKRDREAAKGFL